MAPCVGLEKKWNPQPPRAASSNYHYVKMNFVDTPIQRIKRPLKYYTLSPIWEIFSIKCLDFKLRSLSASNCRSYTSSKKVSIVLNSTEFWNSSVPLPREKSYLPPPAASLSKRSSSRRGSSSVFILVWFGKLSAQVDDWRLRMGN